MATPPARSIAFDLAWLTGCFGISAWWCIACAFRIGPTFDEPTYIAEGLNGWRTWSHGGLMSLGTMPLAIDLQTLPLYLWETWRGTPIDPVSELHAVLPWARLMTLVFWAMLLTYALLIGRRIAGVWGGRIAAALVAVEPNLLAHASLAATDLALAACLVAALYHFERGRTNNRWWLRVGLPALLCAAAVLAKASAVVFIPICFAAIETARLYASGAFQRAAPSATFGSRAKAWASAYRNFVRDYAQMALISTVVVLGYCGTDWRPEDDFVAWAHSLPPGAGATSMVWLAEHCRIFPNGGEAFVRQVKHNLHGHPMYLAGHAGQRGVWYYFPLLLLIKLPLQLTVAALALPLAARKQAWSWPLMCAALLLAYSFTFRVQIGVRMVLPIIALLTIGVGIALVHLQQKRTAWPPVVSFGAIGALWLSMLGSSALAWPHGLCYANALAGGTERSYLLVSDSNFDWGQGVPDLLRWREEHDLPQLDVWYFGTDPRIHAAPLRSMPLHTQQIATLDELSREVEGRYLAVSATIVHGGYVQAEGITPASALVRSLRSQTAVDRAGPFLIYDLAADQPPHDPHVASATAPTSSTVHR